jgi:hypothetical protein
VRDTSPHHRFRRPVFYPVELTAHIEVHNLVLTFGVGLSPATVAMYFNIVTSEVALVSVPQYMNHKDHSDWYICG